jgi:type VI secretion system protein ImpA
MRFKADDLTKPVSEELRCGEDREYDPVFQLLEGGLQSKSEQEYGDTVIPGSGPDWKGVGEHAGALLDRTRDLRVLTYAAISQLHNSGFPAFTESLEALNACMEKYWDNIYPLLDAEDNNDATMRFNSLQVLDDRQMVGDGMERAPLVELKGIGTFSLRDIELAEGKHQPAEGEEVQDLALIQGAFGDAGADEMTALGQSLLGSKKALERTASLFDELAPEAGMLDFDETLKSLSDIIHAVKTYAPVAAAAAGGEDNEEGGEEKVVAHSGAINTRNDVVTAIDRICEYYTAQEPSSPVPILLRRAQRLVSKSFEEILEDMLPESVAKAKVFSGKSD